MLEAIEQQVILLKLLTELQAEQHGVSVSIGHENAVDTFANTTLVVAGYENQGSEVAKLGVLGPTRMDYRQALAAVATVSEQLGHLLSR